MARALPRVALAIALLGCSADCASPPERNFSQFPGFREYRERRGPADVSASARRLLERFRPRFYRAPGQTPPIDFYRDYIAQGELRDASGATVSDRVDRVLLNRYASDPGAVFIHRERDRDRNTQDRRAESPRAVAHVKRAALRVQDRTLRWTLLRYTLVFRDSGLPAGLPLWKRLPLRVLGDPARWHPLDHYTAATVVLDEEQRIVALLLQQHNYQTTYIAGLDFPVPEDQRVRVDIALGSNELYPHSQGRTRHRAVSFLTPEALSYLVTGEDPPFLSADDITDGRVEVEYGLHLLPSDDAFYVFEGWLGRRSGLPGRDAPPGADYNTIPSFKPPAVMLPLAYRWPEAQAYLEQYGALRRTHRGVGRGLPESALRPFRVRLLRALQEAGFYREGEP